MLGQHKPVVAIDHTDIGIQEFLLGDMILIDIGNLTSVDTGERPRGLCRPQIAAIAEGGGHVAWARREETGFKSRQRTKGGCPVEPVFRIGEDIDDI